MISLQRSSQLWASASKSLKCSRDPHIASWRLKTSERSYCCLKHASQLQTASLLSLPKSSFTQKFCPRSISSSNFLFTAPYPLPFEEQKFPKFSNLAHDDACFLESQVRKWERIFNETSYYFENGLRHVYPYYHTYLVNVMGRWVGKTLEHAMKSTFFPLLEPDWVERDLQDKRLLVNWKTPSKDYILKDNDKIQHLVHRHELPVLDKEIDILYCDSHILAINKPPSIPLHPTGRYQHNTLLYILARELKMMDLRVTFRLDMGVSGVLLFARSKAAASYFSSVMRERKTLKTYIARVQGNFPDGLISCDKPLAPICEKTRIMHVCSNGKASLTTFQCLGYSSETNTSVVLCKPHTGRTHQIRVHLQYLGYPIHNDPLYNNPMFGPERGKGGKISLPTSEIVKRWNKGRSRWNHAENAGPGELVLEPWANSKSNLNLFSVDDKCEFCSLHLIVNKTDHMFHLHALQYRGDDWCFSSPMPDWADSSWDPST